MREYLPLLIVGAIIGVFTVAFIVAYAAMKNKKEAIGFDRNIPDKEIISRLMAYAKPYRKEFALIFLIMLLSIGYDLISPVIIGGIEEMIKTDFELPELYRRVVFYALLLVLSMLCTYIQSVMLQRTGQKILSSMRKQLFTHIEGLSHAQLNNIPVGKLVTRECNDTNAISFMFTNILVTMAKNALVIIGVLVAMFMLNLELTLMILCFVPFLVLFTIIFRKFSRRAYRRVKDGTTDINTYLSENLSGIKVTQIYNREARKMQEFLGKSTTLKKAK